MENGSGFTEEDWKAINRFLAAQRPAGGFQKEEGIDVHTQLPQESLTPEQIARIRISDSYVAQYFPSFRIENGDFSPHAKRMKITFPIWKAIIPVDIQYPDQSIATRLLKDVYPDFGIRDIQSAAGYMSAYYNDQKDSILIGTDLHRRAEGISRYWSAIEQMADLASQMDQDLPRS